MEVLAEKTLAASVSDTRNTGRPFGIGVGGAESLSVFEVP